MVLLPIYPARELPIEGVSSHMLMEGITAPCILVEKSRLAETLAEGESDIVVTFGAGDIDRECAEVARRLREKQSER